MPGNHDENIREFCGSVFGNLENPPRVRARDRRRQANCSSCTATSSTRRSSAAAGSRRFGATRYEFMMRINRSVNAVPAAVRPAVLVARHLPQATAAERRAIRRSVRARRGAGGAQPQPRRHRLRAHPSRRACGEIDGVLYCNDGDWVESCTALVERHERRACRCGTRRICSGAPGSGDAGRASRA